MKDWINKVLGNEKTPEAQLEADAGKLMEELSALSELTAFSMARADDKYDELTTALARHSALGDQAAELVRAQDDEGARRCLALQIETAARIKTLQDEYTALQGEAEQKASQFMSRRESVEKKMAQMPKLQDDARMSRQQEEIEKKYSAFSTQSAERSFDKTAQEIEMKKRSLANKSALQSDPNAALDRRIAHSLHERAVDQALAALKAGMGTNETGTSYLEAEIVEDPVAAAKELLAAPRYKGVLPQRSGRTTQ